MKFPYGSVVSTLITGAVCLVVDPFVNSSPQAAPQKILHDVGYPVPGDNSLNYCSGYQEGEILRISEATFNPNPPQRGKTLSIDIVGQLSQKVEGAYVDVVVKLGIIKLLHTMIDLCADDPRANITCPIEKGPVKLHSEIEIPAQIPPALFYVHVQAYTNDDEDLFCLGSKVDFRSHFLRD
ncbi:Phosphatidylglycerol/phosphatidylinositol transfer protein [Golovinomyces cichoracearum]|uniref:Phosphatidylglycerol/phosphatidylinositol transfer protein n=1 Tax=Golovinomyces cichoracearum TaxID=62708 RepID=A0A420IVZ3_9PEZI|nr:Phosphatidylglycerol/phosphatidylinositol transfer protein [Golovinomyces cichoracearum]